MLTVENNPFASVLYVMPKPVGSACNLACSYCYYLEKGTTLGTGEDSKGQLMSDSTLEEFVKQYIAAQTVNEVVFTWHGGEAMMRPIKFYERAMELQRKYGKGREIVNCIQTNGTLLNAKWCEFLKRNNWLVGVSIDGPADAHDAFRRTALGKPTHQSVMRSIRLLQQYGVEWNAMAVVNSVNVKEPERFYDFFKQIGCRYIQFTPVVERRPEGMGNLCSPDDAAGMLTEESITPAEWGEFAVRVFDRWVRNDVGTVYVQLFDATLAGWVGVTPGVCSLAPSCGHAAMMEHNGDLYSCDHFAFPAFKLGNIHQQTIIEMMSSEQQRLFGLRKQQLLPRECKECEYRKACHGECPKNRFVVSPDGERHNFLCAGYRRYFAHVAPVMDFMAAELAAHRAPANIMGHPEILDSLD